MDLKADIKCIHRKLDKVNDPKFIKAIKNMLKYRKETITGRIDIQQYNKELDDSITQIESGKTYNHEEMGERIKQWAKQ